MHVHKLDGCAPAPLAHYLKALGILRLIAEQADPLVRGWWEGQRFRIATNLDEAGVESFFLDRYEPTPFVAPWNKGSGFFQPDDPGLSAIEHSNAPRVHRLQEAIAAGRTVVGEIAGADARVRVIKQEAKQKGLSKSARDAMRKSEPYKGRLAEAERLFKQVKSDLMPRIRMRWRGPQSEWLDTAFVLDEGRNARFPAILGTGGNDGRLDFTNNFMQRLTDVFDFESSAGAARRNAGAWLRSALWGTPAMGCLEGCAVGQFLPGGAGGANAVNGPQGDSILNPFDFILMMEGSVLMQAALTRRAALQRVQRAAAPFVVDAQAVGYATASEQDESARGEQWMPLWNQPMDLAETKRLFSEGRAQLGHDTANVPLDMARAAARLGVARGIVAFQRFGYIERNGQSNLAVPIGLFRVRAAPTASTQCLDDVAEWLTRVRRRARDDAPARWMEVVQRAGDAALVTASQPEVTQRWESLLLRLVDIESVMRTGTGFDAQPIPALRPQWVAAAGSGSAEFRLALAFALQARAFRSDGGQPIDQIRRHWLPLEVGSRRARFSTATTGTHVRLEHRTDVVIHGRSGIDDAIALVERRMIESVRSGVRGFPLQPAPRAGALLGDIQLFIEGQADPDRVLRLGRALMALDRQLWAQQIVEYRRPARQAVVVDDAWACIRLAHSPWPFMGGQVVSFDPSIVRRLAAADASTAVELALRRLRAVGMRPAVRAAIASPHVARLWAAALAFPISRSTAARLTRQLDPSFAEEQFT